jgi:hypothetical protein
LVSVAIRAADALPALLTLLLMLHTKNKIERQLQKRRPEAGGTETVAVDFQ